MKPLLERATRWSLSALPVLLAAGPTSHLAAQGTVAIPAAPFRGTLSLGDRVVPIQIRWSRTSEPRIQIAAPIGMDDSTSRPMRRDPRGDTLLAVIPGFGDTLRFAPRLEGESLRGSFRGNVVTFFASRGIAVLSWDKRGNGGSGGSLATANIDTLAADGEAAIRWLRTRPEIDPTRVGVWGISQGGWPASIVAAHDSSLAFVILHSGSSLTPAVQGEDEMRMRVIETGGTQGAMDEFLAYYRLYLDVLRGVTTRESLDDVYRALRAKGNRYIWSPAVATSARERWQVGINDFDPVPNWSKARVPVLALFGEFDAYVPPETNVPVLRAAFARSGNRDTTIVVFRNANHRFEESSRRISSDWVIGSRYVPEYYTTMTSWLDRRVTGKR